MPAAAAGPGQPLRAGPRSRLLHSRHLDAGQLRRGHRPARPGAGGIHRSVWGRRRRADVVGGVPARPVPAVPVGAVARGRSRRRPPAETGQRPGYPVRPPTTARGRGGDGPADPVGPQPVRCPGRRGVPDPPVRRARPVCAGGGDRSDAGSGRAGPGGVLVVGAAADHAAVVGPGVGAGRTARSDVGDGGIPRPAAAGRAGRNHPFGGGPPAGVRVRPLAAGGGDGGAAGGGGGFQPGRVFAGDPCRKEADMSVRRLLLLLLGWSAVSCLLMPLLFAAWVSFSPDSFLTPPTGEWSVRWYTAFAADRRWASA